MMNFEADLSFTPSSSRQDARQGRSQDASAVWDHYCLACDDDEDSNSKLKYCIYCTVSLIYHISISANMQKHLKT